MKSLKLSFSLSREKFHFFLFLALASLIFIIAILIFPFDNLDPLTDLGNYFHNYWEFLPYTSLFEQFEKYEPGFIILTKIINSFASFSTFVWLVHFFIFCSLFFLVFHIVPSATFAFLVAGISLLFYPPIVDLSGVAIRQGIASSVFFILLRMNNLKDFEEILSMKALVILVLFHYSAILVVVAVMLLRAIDLMNLSKMLPFYLWLTMNILYISNISGEVGLSIYEGIGFSISTLEVFNSIVNFEYSLGYKISFLLLNLLFIAIAIVFRFLGLLNISLRSLLVLPLFRLFFLLNAMATLSSLLPFHDRFFDWSWIIGPLLFAYVVGNTKQVKKARF